MPNPVTDTGANLGDTVSSIYKPAIQEAEKIDKKTEEGIQKMDREKSPSPPTPIPIPKPEDYRTDPMKSFGSAAMMIATLGSLFTRRPMTNALNAGAAVMNAKNSQNYAAFKQATDLWKTETENAWKQAEFEQKQYEDVIHKDESELRAKAASFKDEVMLHALDAKMQAFLFKDREKNVAKIQESWMEQLYANSKMQEIANKGGTPEEQMKAYFQALGEAKGTVSGKNGQVLTEDQYESTYKNDPEIKSLAKSWHSGETIQSLVPGWSKDNPRREAVQKKAYEMFGDFDWAQQHIDYMAKSAGARNLTTLTNKIQLASNMLDRSLPSLLDSARQLGLSPSTDINALYNTARKHMSSKDFANFSTQLRAVTSDYAQFMGRGRQTVHSDQEALRILNEDMGITSLEGFQDAVNIETRNVNAAIAQTKEDVGETAKSSPAVSNNSISENKKAAGKPIDEKYVQELIDHRDDPEAIKSFDKYFGDGAAEAILQDVPEGQ